MSEGQFEELLESEIHRGGARVAYNAIGNPDVVVKMIHGPFVGANVGMVCLERRPRQSVGSSVWSLHRHQLYRKILDDGATRQSLRRYGR